MSLRRMLHELTDAELSVALHSIEGGTSSVLPAVLAAPGRVVGGSSLPPPPSAPPAVRDVHGGGVPEPPSGPADVPWEALARRHVKPRLIPSRRRGYQGVTALTGMPGSGKTYTLCEIGVGYRAMGWPVWSNAGFDFGMSTGDDGCHTYNSFEELADIVGPACILIDEAQLYFNARRWQDFPDGFLYSLSQVRKLGVHLYYTSLHWDMIDKNLRNLTFNVWECEAMALRGWFVRRRFPPEHVRRKDERSRDKHRVKVNLGIAELYDTTARVAVGPRPKLSPRETARWALPAASAVVPTQEAGGGAAASTRADNGRQLGMTADHPRPGSPGTTN